VPHLGKVFQCCGCSLHACRPIKSSVGFQCHSLPVNIAIRYHPQLRLHNQERQSSVYKVTSHLAWQSLLVVLKQFAGPLLLEVFHLDGLSRCGSTCHHAVSGSTHCHAVSGTINTASHFQGRENELFRNFMATKCADSCDRTALQTSVRAVDNPETI
jgi:hypothetical protein